LRIITFEAFKYLGAISHYTKIAYVLFLRLLEWHHSAKTFSLSKESFLTYPVYIFIIQSGHYLYNNFIATKNLSKITELLRKTVLLSK